jgi:hypothetical protein
MSSRILIHRLFKRDQTMKSVAVASSQLLRLCSVYARDAAPGVSRSIEAN